MCDALERHVDHVNFVRGEKLIEFWDEDVDGLGRKLGMDLTKFSGVVLANF